MVKISIALHMSTYLYVYKYKELGYDHIEYLKRIRRILRVFFNLYAFTSLVFFCKLRLSHAKYFVGWTKKFF